jgi:hypothetical protein
LLIAADSSSDEGQVFADAREGVLSPTSPIPITRVEKVDDEPSYGEVPGTPAYDKRMSDAVPDEIAVIPEGSESRPSSRALHSPVSPGGSPIPKTRVQKVDPLTPSHGEVPGTDAYELRKADALPDAIEKVSELETPILSDPPSRSKPPTTVPRTVVTRVDSEPSHGEVPGTEAYNLRKSDADPDILEKKGDVPSKHNLNTRLYSES